VSEIVVGLFQTVQVEHHKAEVLIGNDACVNQLIALVAVIETGCLIPEQLVLCTTHGENSHCDDVHQHADHNEKQRVGRTDKQEVQDVQRSHCHEQNHGEQEQPVPHIVLVLGIDADLKDQQEQRLHQDAVIVQFLGLPQRQQTQQMRRKCCQNKHCVDHQQHAGYFSDRPGFSRRHMDVQRNKKGCKHDGKHTQIGKEQCVSRNQPGDKTGICDLPQTDQNGNHSERRQIQS